MEGREEEGEEEKKEETGAKEGREKTAESGSWPGGGRHG